MKLPAKKIALVTFANQPGGVTTHIRSIVERLHGRELSFKVIICSKRQDMIRDAIASSGSVAVQDMIFIAHYKKCLFFPFMAELVDIFRREAFDIVDAFDDQTQTLAGMAAWLAGIKIFLCHNEGHFSPSTVSMPKRMFYLAMNFFLKGYFTRTIAVSGGVAKELVVQGLRPRDKVEVLNLGISINADPGQDYALHGLDEGAPVIGAVSRLSSEKGLERFVQAAVIVAREIPRARFVICGEGSEKEGLMALARTLALEGRFEFLPWTKDVPSVMRMLDVYVLPSVREGLGITLLEAMAAGRPSVASDIDGVREVVDNGVNGILVDTADIHVFAETIISLCRDKEKARRLGQKGLERVRAHFSIDREMAHLQEIYHALCCRMKVAVVCSTLNQLGGPAFHIRNIYNYLNGRDCRLTLILCSANEDALRDFMRSGGVVDEDMIFIPHVQKRWLMPFMFTLGRIFREERYDVIHAFETQTQVLAGTVARCVGVRRFVCNAESQFLPITISWPKRLLFRLLNHWLKDYFFLTLCISHGLAAEIIDGGLRPADRVIVLSVGIPLSGAPPADVFRNADIVVGALSRLSAEKGIDRLLYAAVIVHKACPQVKFVITGDGDERERLEALANDLGLAACVEFHPWNLDARGVLEQYDIYVMPSLREGLGITLLEAMALARPCVASDIEGIRDVITSGVDGVLLDTSRPEVFAEAIISLCHEKDRAIRMGKKGFEKVYRQFCVDQEMHRLREIYVQMCAGRQT